MTTDQLKLQKDNFENIETAWEGDLWDRRRLGEQLTSYVDRLNCGAVLALDARWGEGKTWFVRHWAKHLADTQHNVIYLDAFANDYLDDPFLTIAAEISQTFKESEEFADDEIKNFNAKTASVLISLAAVIPIIAAKAGMHWIGLGGAGEAFQEVYKDGKELYDTASEEIATKVKEEIEKKIENHQVEKQTIQDFKKDLAELAKKLDKPLVFIIDELDRCRPDFAIRLIERIKHFFDIPKIVFVLVMDKAQFSKVICYNYGYDENLGDEYLDKFIDFRIVLPAISTSSLDNYTHHEKVATLLKEAGVYTDDICFVLSMGQIGNIKTIRQLKRIINQFSLLKQNRKSDIFLALALISEPADLEHKWLNIFFNIIIGGAPSNYRMSLKNLNSQDMNKFRKFVKTRFGFKELELLNSIQYLRDINSDDDFKELFLKYNLDGVDDWDEFSKQFKYYIECNLY